MNKNDVMNVVRQAAKRGKVTVKDLRIVDKHLQMTLKADNDRPAQVGMIYTFSRLSEKEIALYTLRFCQHWCHGEPYKWGGWGDSLARS